MNSLVLTLALLAFQQKPIEDIISRLGSEALGERESAQAELMNRWEAWTAGELDKLRKVTSSPDAETAARSKAVVEYIGLRRHFPLIPTETWKHFPDLRVLIKGGDPGKIGRLLQDMDEASKRGEISPRALVPAAVEFIEDDRDTGVGTGCWSMGREHTYLVRQLASGLIWDSSPCLADLDSKEEALKWWRANAHKSDKDWNLDGLVHKEDRVRAESVVRLARLKDPTLTEALFASIKGIHDEYAFERAAKSLLHLPPKALLPQLHDRLKDENLDLRTRALDLIVRVDDPRSHEILIETLEDPAQRVGDYYGAIANPRICDVAGQLLAKALDIGETPFDWPESVRARDRHLEKIRNAWRVAHRMSETPLPGMPKAISSQQLDELLPGLLHDSTQQRIVAQKKLSQLGPGAWPTLRLEIRKSNGVAKERLNEASRYLCQSVQSITAHDDTARAFTQRIQSLMHRPFDFEVFHKEVLAAWFEDKAYAKLKLVVTREEDGRGASISVEALKNKNPDSDLYGFWVWNLGSGALWTWKRKNFDEEMRKQFSGIMSAEVEGPDGQAGLVLSLIKVGPDEKSLADD
jgi:HEAT repeat protein